MKTDLKIEGVILALVAGMLAFSAYAWNLVPERIPVHFDLFGNPDRYGGRVEGLLMVPLITIGLQGVLAVIPRLDPSRTDRYEAFAGPFATIRVAFAALMFVIHGCLVGNALAWPIDLVRVLAVALGLFFAVLGNTFGKVRPNRFVGFRTPWTFSSKTSWIRTHRVMGVAWTATGAAAAACGVILPAAGLVVLVAGALISTVAGTAYSWWVWKHDEAREPALEA